MGTEKKLCSSLVSHSRVQVKYVSSQVVHGLSRFLWHEATRSISTPPPPPPLSPWSGSQYTAGVPPALIWLLPIYTPGWKEALDRGHNTMTPAKV